MHVLTRLLVLLAIATISSTTSVWAQAEERTVYVSAVDKDDAPVAGLSASDFIVREDDAREVLRASAATEPLQIGLLIDTSQAIDPYLLDLRKALGSFIKQLGGTHDISLVGFGERPTVLVDYTRDVSRLEKGLGVIFPRSGSGTYLLDAIVESAEALARRKAPRRHIIVVTAQGLEFSERHHDSVLETLRETGVTLHSLVLTRTGTSRSDRAGQELDMALAEGTRMTGGRRDDLLTSMSLGDRLQSVANELTHQYQVTYGRPRTLLPPKSLEVRVKRPNVTVRARRWPQEMPQRR
jgi:Ca-activated chloride channel homolog